MKKLLISLLLLLPLTGCIPAAFLVGAGATGAIAYDKRSSKVMLQDRNITDTAQGKLDETRSLDGKAYIQVYTFNRTVLLVGQATSSDVIDHAYRIVKSVPGIRRIYNQITIGQPTSLTQRSDDAWITTKTKSAMLLEKGLRSGQIKVVTQNDIVYLMGVVSPSQGKLAAKVARHIKGVEKVVKVFQYTAEEAEP